MMRKIMSVGLLALCADAACPDVPGDCPDLATCWKEPTVLEDVATGWSNDCEGLKLADGVTDIASCGVACVEDLNCTVWQYSGINETANPKGHCYTGTPDSHCRDVNRSGYTVNAGQRLQRGAVKVLKPAFPNLQVIGLLKYDMKYASHDLDVARCKSVCYSDVTCGVWQYSVEQGCWREHKTNKATSTDTASAFALNVSAGEYVLHYCPPIPPNEKNEGNALPWIILAIIAGLLLCFGILCFCLSKPKKPKKTRAVKIEKDEEAVVPLFIPQPTVLVQQPSVVYAAPAPTTSVVYTTPSVSYTQVAQPTYTTSVAAPTTYVTQQPTTYMTQPTVVSEAVAVQEPLLGETVVVGQ